MLIRYILSFKTKIIKSQIFLYYFTEGKGACEYIELGVIIHLIISSSL